jgi:hypothetical protein
MASIYASRMRGNFLGKKLAQKKAAEAEAEAAAWRAQQEAERHERGLLCYALHGAHRC